MLLAKLYFVVVMALISTDLSIFEFQFGEGRGLLYDRTAREKQKHYFWISWSAWAVLAMFMWVVAGILALRAERAGWMASVAELMTANWKDILVLALGTFLAGLFAWRWYQRGSPGDYWRYAKKKGALRAYIRRLASDEDTGIEGAEFGDLIAVADIEWLSYIVEHLKAQSEPRSLSLAIRETEDTYDALD